ncbi:hypothetical protein MVES1_003245 [Malassezia vespertilionis]|uniref:uncharacterized protein n=1 Tax=Malassezia vespertilionis TaxID=2020962 RepID=UPI0024B16FBA|nr:uncharacterized protein MVES1_003245 [Malassezia vespertilionis]WFD07877.1 hypothetical protein MVES1_003245 [Malassezia vespertilionis]
MGAAVDMLAGAERDALLNGTDNDTVVNFQTLAELRESVEKLERELVIERPMHPLSGRIIHVTHGLPFTIESRAEVEYRERKEQQMAARDMVALMAQRARARRRKQSSLAAERMREQAQYEIHKQHSNRKHRESSGSGSRCLCGTNSLVAMRSELLDSEDLEVKLLENQERSQRRAGRRAWMTTEAVADSDASEEDKFSPVGSRRSSRHRASVSSLSTVTSAFTDALTGLSDQPSPKTPDEPPRRPPWCLSLNNEHVALNSAIFSLCETHMQTYIGWPGNVQFAASACNDERTDPSETTLVERQEIDQVLASLQDRSAWALHENSLEIVAPAREAHRNGIKFVPAWLDRRAAHAHYEGYCKSTLWSLFHYLLWRDDTERSKWDLKSWDAYVKVNKTFADHVVAEYQAGDIVWVHDYHLLLVPHLVRQKIHNAHVGLFIHSAFPSSEFFRCLPQRREVLEGMLGADLVCFQNHAYARHFISSCVRILGYEVQGSSIESLNGRVTHVAYNPIGIDVERVEHFLGAPGVAPKIAQLRELYAEKRIIIGCDKLDVVRGVIQKLEAFYDLLKYFPEWREKVVLIQITIPALNSSAKLERQVAELVNQINGDFGSLSFTPVQHYHQVIERDEYYALLSVADLALVTSVRDGMNTMSMEYIVCQDRSKQGALILSEFTGTAGRLFAAIQINPWDIDGVAAAIDHGLRLAPSEREYRHAECHKQVLAQTSHTWALTTVQQMLLRLRYRYSAHSTPELDCRAMMACFVPAGRRLLLLDYDGTLTPIVKDPDSAVPSRALLDALRILSEDPRNIIYIISGRDENFLSKHFGALPRIGLSAEHGSYFREHGLDEQWQNLSSELDMSWKPDVLAVFRYYTDRTIGSMIEEKKSSIVWHYRNADPDFGSFQAKDCQALLANILAQNDMQVEVVVGKKNLEVRPLAINKGEIVHRILYANPDTQFVFCAGDDKTDEDMFRFLSSLTPDHPSTKIEDAPFCGKESVVVTQPAPLNKAQPRNLPAKRICSRREQMYTTTVGPNSKQTLANWHVQDVSDVIRALTGMASAET